MKILTAYLLIILSLPAASLPAWGAIPGDSDGDNIVSSSELAAAEGLLKEGNIAQAQMDEIRIIHERYPRTVVDSNNRSVTVYKPVERVIAYGGYDAEILYILGDEAKIVGVPGWLSENDFRRLCLPSLVEKPTVGSANEPDLEKVLELKPDLVICWHYYPEKLESQLPENITVLGLDLFDPRTYLDEARKLAYIMDKEERIDKYIDGFYSKYMNMIGSRTESIPDEARPKVYWERLKPYETFGAKPYITPTIELCGGRNIFAHDDFDIAMTDAESVVKANPDVIIRYAPSKGPETGYSVDDPANAEELRNSVIGRPELSSVSAVKNGSVYVMSMNIALGIQGPVGAAYAARIIQPELFSDLDPRAMTEELLRDYLRTEFDVREHGLFVYPPRETD